MSNTIVIGDTIYKIIRGENHSRIALRSKYEKDDSVIFLPDEVIDALYKNRIGEETPLVTIVNYGRGYLTQERNSDT